jgi:hypothetical protein
MDIDGMAAILTKIFAGSPPPSMPDAECRDVSPAIMDAVDDPAEALRICARCPELASCRDWLATTGRNTVTGVVAGQVRPFGHIRPRREAS